jgi:hypothetical protein
MLTQVSQDQQEIRDLEEDPRDETRTYLMLWVINVKLRSSVSDDIHQKNALNTDNTEN